MANMAAFYETRNCFCNFIDYTEPLSFDEWAKVPEDRKVAFLFVQFFKEITLAWDKANQFDFIEGEEGVTTVLQYLQKQVCDTYIKGHPKKKVSKVYAAAHPDECEERHMIEEKPERFSPGYIYRTAYNAMYCICHDLKSVKDRWDFETDSVVMYDGKELSLFDTFADKGGSVADLHDSESFEDEFWSIIEDTGLSGEKVMRYLLSENKADLLKLSPSSRLYKQGDPLRDVEVSLERAEEIIAELKEAFLSLPKSSPCRAYISQFPVLASL